MHGRIDAHRRLVRVLTGDAGVHVEQVAVLLLDGRLTHALHGGGEVEVDTATHLALVAVLVDLVDERADAAALVTHVLRLT